MGISRGASAFVLFALVSGGAIAGAKVYMTPAEALAKSFSGHDAFDDVRVRLTEEDRAALLKSSGLRESAAPGAFHRFRKGSEVLGWAFIQDRMGKHEPITFITRMDSLGKVVDVEILVYRESRGGEVASAKWLKQFAGKDGKASLKVGRDVANFAGATISSNAVADGTRRALALLPFAQKQAPPIPAPPVVKDGEAPSAPAVKPAP